MSDYSLPASSKHDLTVFNSQPHMFGAETKELKVLRNVGDGKEWNLVKPQEGKM